MRRSFLITLIKQSQHKKWSFPLRFFFSKCDQILSFLPIWSHLLKKSLMENFFICAVNSETALKKSSSPAGIYLLVNNKVNKVNNKVSKVNNRNTRTRCEMCSKLKIKTAERRQWNIFPLTYFTPCSIVFVGNFEHEIADWVI